MRYFFFRQKADRPGSTEVCKTDSVNQFLLYHRLTKLKNANCARLSTLFDVLARIRFLPCSAFFSSTCQLCQTSKFQVCRRVCHSQPCLLTCLRHHWRCFVQRHANDVKLRMLILHRGFDVLLAYGLNDEFRFPVFFRTQHSTEPGSSTGRLLPGPAWTWPPLWLGVPIWLVWMGEPASTTISVASSKNLKHSIAQRYLSDARDRFAVRNENYMTIPIDVLDSDSV